MWKTKFLQVIEVSVKTLRWPEDGYPTKRLDLPMMMINKSRVENQGHFTVRNATSPKRFEEINLQIHPQAFHLWRWTVNVDKKKWQEASVERWTKVLYLLAQSSNDINTVHSFIRYLINMGQLYLTLFKNKTSNYSGPQKVV